MSRPVSSFSIEVGGAELNNSEMGNYVASHVFRGFRSEAQQEELGRDIGEAIFEYAYRKIMMAKAENEWQKVKTSWFKRHPPNHAGYYYCHLCGGWVHATEAELDHVIPKSIRREGWDPNNDDNLRPIHASATIHCIGNYGKGSRQMKSTTMEIAPPDEEC